MKITKEQLKQIIKEELEAALHEEELSEGVGPGYIVTHNKNMDYGSTNRLKVGYTTLSDFKLKDNQMFFATREEAEEAKKKLQAADRAAEKEDAEDFFKKYKADQPRRRRVAGITGNAPEVAMEPSERIKPGQR